ncbi:DEAD/DEAH box helicase family protein [Methylocystis echinoides]|uniref:DEAD/DEAH box helicase family protein n=1 Tax=Methylocystis echinoides TaxID=29468 RepID=UPI00341EF5A9
MTTITVLDSIMGSGKTTYVINMINTQHTKDLAQSFANADHEPTRFLVVVPLLSEVDRFTHSCPDLRFKDPQPVHSRKLYHLERLIDDGENVVTTHALFRMLDRTIYGKLKSKGYKLIVDEALECVEMFDKLSEKDRKLLFDNNMVYVDKDTRRLRWNYETHPDYSGRFTDFKHLCDIGSLVFIKDKILLWEFPSEFLTCFNEVLVCTYLFKGSPFYAYLQAEGFDIHMNTIMDGSLCEWDEGRGDEKIRSQLRSLITIYEGPMNRRGDANGLSNPLSSTWFGKASPEELKGLRSSTETFFARVAKSPSKVNGWTTFAKVKAKLAGKGYTRGWIPNNAKGTNDYVDKQAMAYLCNWFYHPVIKGYFHERGITVDEDMYALSAMIQWIWRSRIRRGEPIHVFIPSERMRGLLREWLNPVVYHSNSFKRAA